MHHFHLESVISDKSRQGEHQVSVSSEQRLLTGKKLPMIHSKIVPRSNRTGLTKKKVTNTPLRPAAPPQPIITMAKLKVEMSKPTNLIGVGSAYRLYASPT